MISAEAFKEIREAMSALVAVSQMQADSLISIQRKADVSELKAERALADKDGKKAGSILRWRCWRRPCRHRQSSARQSISSQLSLGIREARLPRRGSSTKRRWLRCAR